MKHGWAAKVSDDEGSEAMLTRIRLMQDGGSADCFASSRPIFVSLILWLTASLLGWLLLVMLASR